MEDKLKLYLWWKKRLASAKEDGRVIFGMPRGSVSVEMGSGIVSEVMRGVRKGEHRDGGSEEGLLLQGEEEKEEMGQVKAK